MNSISPEIGKTYVTRNGAKSGPIQESDDYEWPLEAALVSDVPNDRVYYRSDGSCPYMPEYDIVAEWPL